MSDNHTEDPTVEIWTPHRSRRKLVTHSKARCHGKHCPVHNPSNHHMKDWPQHYREDRGITERICPHGIGHPDPDQNFPKGSIEWDHGCDGCCMKPKRRKK